MSQTARWRFNPFTGVYNPVLITGEQHVIAYSAELNAYGIFTDECIKFDTPSTVAIAGYTEVSRLTTPAGTQFRVDYLAATYWSTSFIEFHSSQNGNTVSVNYYGLGTALHPNFRLLTNYNFAGNIVAEGTANFVGRNISESSSSHMFGGVERTLRRTDVNGAIWDMTNVYEEGGDIKLRNTGTAFRFIVAAIYIRQYQLVCGWTRIQAPLGIL